MYSAGLGFTLGIVYDLFRMLFYLLTGSDKKFLLLRDIIYLLVFLAATFVFLLAMCDGQLLLYVFIAMGTGLYVYFYSLSSVVYPPFKRLLKGVKRVLRQISNRLSAIKTRFLSLREKIFKILHKITKKDLHIRHNIVYNFFVKLCSGILIFKNRGDEDGSESEKRET